MLKDLWISLQSALKAFRVIFPPDRPVPTSDRAGLPPGLAASWPSKVLPAAPGLRALLFPAATGLRENQTNYLSNYPTNYLANYPASLFAGSRRSCGGALAQRLEVWVPPTPSSGPLPVLREGRMLAPVGWHRSTFAVHDFPWGNALSTVLWAQHPLGSLRVSSARVWLHQGSAELQRGTGC